MNTIKRLPTLFIPHGGGPCFFIDPPAAYPHMWDGLAAYLRGIDASLGARPKAVLVISGHWENPLPTFNIAAKPGLLFDYYGFPEHTYRLKYPATGAPELAERVRKLGGVTLRSIGQIGKLQTIQDNNEDYVPPREMLRELMEDNKHVAAAMRKAHKLCDDHEDSGTAGLLETFIDETERRTWFLFEASRQEGSNAA